jgi:hypothetical protein
MDADDQPAAEVRYISKAPRTVKAIFVSTSTCSRKRTSSAWPSHPSVEKNIFDRIPCEIVLFFLEM